MSAPSRSMGFAGDEDRSCGGGGVVTPLRPSDAALRGRGGIAHAWEAPRQSYDRCHGGSDRPELSVAAEIRVAGGESLRLL